MFRMIINYSITMLFTFDNADSAIVFPNELTAIYASVQVGILYVAGLNLTLLVLIPIILPAALNLLSDELVP